MTITSVTTSTTSQFTIGTGNELLVANGGVVSAPTIQNGGALVISGGIDSGAVVSSGGTETVSAGSANGDQIYGVLSNLSGAVTSLTNEIVESGGKFYEYNSAVVTGTIVESGGLFILSGNTSGANSNTTLIGGGMVELITAKATLGGTITFSGGHNVLAVSATISSGAGDQAVISGFSSTDVIDLQTLTSASTLSLSVTTSGANTVAQVMSGGAVVSGGTYIFAGKTSYASGALSLAADLGGHAEIVYGPASGSGGVTTSVTTSTAPGAYTVSSGNTLVVAGGGSVSAAIVQAGGVLVVSSGADATAVVSVGATETVLAGQASGDLIYGAATVSGGAVTGEIVEAGGSLGVSGGAAVVSTTVLAGGTETVSGSAAGDQIFGALTTVSGVAGVLTGETVQSGGMLTLANANAANGVVVLGGGTFVVSGADAGAAGTVLSGGGVLDLASPKALITGALTFSGGGNTLEVASLASAGLGDQAVLSGFSSSDMITIAGLGAGAALTVSTSGGNDDAKVTGASGSETFIFAGAATYTNNTLYLVSAGGVIDLEYNPDPMTLTVADGTTSSGLTVSSGVTLTVQAGGTVGATTVLGGGVANVSGTDVAATISAGGVETVYGSASGDQIAGGVIVVGAAGGETVLAGGSLAVNGGANASAIVSLGGAESVGASGTTSGDEIYGAMTVNGGTVTSGTVQGGGSITLSAGGDVSTTILAGGNELVLASATGDQIYGTQLVSAATAVVTGETVYAGGAIDLFLKGGVASGTLVSSGGALNVSGAAFANDTALSGGGVLDLESPKAEATGSLTFAGGGNTLEITGVTTAGDGDLAVNSGFSSTDRIDITSAAFTGSALTLSQTLSGGNTVVEVLSGGSTVVELFTFAGTTLDGYFALLSDGNGGENLEVPPVSVTTSVTTFTAAGAFTENATDTLLVLSGGSVSAATIDQGGFLSVSGGADTAADVLAGGVETVYAGSASGDQIYGSAVVSGGTVAGETVLSGGVIEVAAGATAGNVVLSGGGVAVLASPTAALSGMLTFVGGGNTLVAAAIANGGSGDQSVISGFSSADKIDVTGIGSTGATLAFGSDGAGDAVVTVSGGGDSQSFLFSDPTTYKAGAMSLIADGAGGVDLILDTTPVVTLTSLGGDTNAASQIVNGTVDTAVDPEAVGTTVTVSEGSTVVGTSTVGANGQWSAKVTFANDDGANVLTASDTDAAGDTGVTSQPLTFAVDTAAAAFIPGDLVISLSGDGDGSGAYGDNAASPVTLEQITTAGSIVSQLVLPQVTTVVNGVTEYAISSEYGSQSEGSLELSADGHSLVIAGYGVNAQTFNNAGAAVYGNSALAQSTSVLGGQYVAVARVVADINASGVVDTSTALYDVFNENNPRSVATVDGSSFYLSGQGLKGDTTQGVRYAADGASSATSINDATDTRTAVIYNGQLYVSADTTQGATNISTYGALPTSATSPTVLSGLSNAIVLTSANANTANAADVGQSVNLSPENFFFANADTLYVADSGNPKQGGVGDGGLQKWVFNGSQWTLQYTLSSGLNLVAGTAGYGTSGLIGLTGKVVGGSVDLYATSYNLTDIEPTYVYSITDSLSAASGAGESFSTIFTAAPGSNVRGIAFAPTGYAPTISGTVAGQTTNSEAAVTPFAEVTIADANSGAAETLTITVGGAGGVLSGAGLTGGAGGVYTLAGSAAALTSALDAVSFTPAAGQPNSSSTSTFTLSDQSSAYATATVDGTTTVVDSDPAVAPTISGTVAGQATTSEAAVTPFAGVTVADANSGGSDTLTITVGGAGGVLSGAGLTGGAGGVYTLAGSAAALTSALDALSFAPAVGQANTSSTSTFTLSDQSSAYGPPAVDATTTVVDSDPAVAPTISGTVAGQMTTSETTVAPFAGVTIGDANSGGTEILMISVSGTGGVLKGGGLSADGGGVYTLAGSAAAVTSAIEALAFVPTAGRPNSTSTSTLTLSDQSSVYDAPTVDATTTVTDIDPAQTIIWKGLPTLRHDGGWNNASEWTPGFIPAAGDSAAITTFGAYTVSVTQNNTVGDLTISDPSAILAISSVTLALSGPKVSASNATITLASGGALTVASSFANNGKTDLTGGMIGGGAAGAVLANGASTSAGALSGWGTVGDGDLAIINGKKGTINANGAAALTLVGDAAAIVNAGLVEATGAGGLVIEGALANTGRVTLSATGATQIVGDVAGAVLTNGTVTLAGTISGAGTVGGADLALVNQSHGIIDATGASKALVLNAAAATLANQGLIESTAAGGLTIEGSVANAGMLRATKGVLMVTGAVSGPGVGQIGAGTLDLGGAFDQNVTFLAGSRGTLELADSQAYTAQITGFSLTGANALDLTDIAFASGTTTAAYSGTAAGGVLTVTDGTHTASLHLKGNFLRSTFTLSSDGNGGTKVIDPAAGAAPTASVGLPALHQFIAAAAGLGAKSTASLAPALASAREALRTLALPHA